jgi:quercetin dioxygenase-like cupin family protein
MFTTAPPATEMSDAWIEGDDSARWRSSSGHGPGEGARASGSSLLEVDQGCRLPRHTDSAEETVVVVAGTAEVTVGEETDVVPAGGVALVPECVPHEVRNAGDETLRFVAVYASTDVTTTYEHDVQPDGGRERDPIG